MCGVLGSDTTERNKALLKKKGEIGIFECLCVGGCLWWYSSWGKSFSMFSEIRSLYGHWALRDLPGALLLWHKAEQSLVLGSQFQSFHSMAAWSHGPEERPYVKVGSMWWRKLAHLQTPRKQTAEKVSRTTQILPGYPVAPSFKYNPPPNFHRPRPMLSKHKPING